MTNLGNEGRMLFLFDLGAKQTELGSMGYGNFVTLYIKISISWMKSQLSECFRKESFLLNLFGKIHQLNKICLFLQITTAID